MNLKNKKILVTGGSGFIGSHLIKKLEQAGATVENFDLSQGKNILNTLQFKNEIKKKFDIIYHLAGFSGSAQSNLNPKRSFEVNTFAVINLIAAIITYSPQTKLVLSSSRLEYGKPLYLPVDENHPTNPISAYGLSKLAATQIALIYHENSNLNVTVFRTSNVYGSYQKSEFSGYNVVNQFIDLARGNKAIAIFGDGSQKRDYFYIDDLIDAFLLARLPKTSGQIYNLGFGQPISVKEMAELIVKKVGRGFLKFVKWPKGFKMVETGDYITDISKIKKDLGFRPNVNFEAGIQKTISNLK